MVTLVAGSAFAKGSGKNRSKGQGMGYNQQCPGYGGQNALNNLSQKQRDEFSALRQKFIDETYEFRAAKFQKQQEMRMLMETSNPDRDKIDKLSEKITDFHKQIRNKQIDFQLSVKKISPELGMGNGFRQGYGRHSQRGGQNACQGGSGYRQYVN